MRLEAHEWLLLFFGAVFGAIWTYVALALSYDTPLITSLTHQPLGWIALVALAPAIAVLSLGAWSYEQGIQPIALIGSVALMSGTLPAIAVIAWLRIRGV